MAYLRDGVFSRLPADFELPSTSPQIAFQLWCCGNELKGWPPLGKVFPSDAGADKNAQRRFSDYRGLMRKAEDLLKEKEQWIDNPTLEQVNQMYLAISDELFPAGKGRMMKWATYVRQKHEDKKRKRKQ
jgi:hypothetical protein